MAPPVHTRPWFTLSIPAGNALQIGNLLGAGALIRRARRPGVSHRPLLLAGGWLLAYFNSHALAHWAAGRLGGIRFVGYGMHGTTNPAGYPPGVRAIFTHLPLFSARTDPASRRAVRPAARAAMYAAGPLSTVLTSIAIPAYGRAMDIPRARALLSFAVLWMAGMLAGEVAPHSDLRRAWRELRKMSADL